MMGCTILKNEFKPNFYQSVCWESWENGRGKHDKRIRKDIEANAWHHSPQRKRALYMVLKAFLHWQSDLVYKSGITAVAGFLLLHMAQEEDVFFALFKLFNSKTYHLRDIYQGREMEKYLGMLEEVFQDRFPLLSRHFYLKDLELGSVVADWIICLYSSVLPDAYVSQIWEQYLSSGINVLLNVALSIIAHCHDSILFLHSVTQIKAFFQSLRRIPEGLVSIKVDTTFPLAETVGSTSPLISRPCPNKSPDAKKTPPREERKSF